MTKAKTPEEVIAEFKALNCGNTITFPNGYKSRSRCHVVCGTCGNEWDPYISGYLNNGNRCSKCAINIRTVKSRHTVKSIVDKLKKKNTDYLFDFEGKEYTSIDQKITFTHKSCGHTYQASIYGFLKGSECPNCARKTAAQNAANTLRKTDDEIISKFMSVHGDRYSYNFGEDGYVSTRTKILITHKECNNTFSMRSSAHLQGQGCPFCSKESGASKQRTSKKELIKRLKKVHQDMYSFDLETIEYKNSGSKILIKHESCGYIYTQSIMNYLKGSGCPKCNNTGFDTSKPAILYYLRLNTSEGILYKIGITNRTVEERFSKADREKITKVWTWKYALGRKAYDEEQELLKLCKEHQYTGPDVLSSGNTELFTEDVLGLDN